MRNAREARISKLRMAENELGPAPAGFYFARLARALRAANEAETARCESLDAEDRALEARYRRAPKKRAKVRARADEIHAASA
ncbi:MAG: hypothetical protein AB7O04_14460 [Hyphomonadaceae bacterium]